MGRTMKVTAELPDGTQQTLLHLKNWDFHWQDTFDFKTPMALPKGTKLLLEATYDTSLNNPNTPPDLPKTIAAGKRAVDEMCVAWIACVRSEGK